MRTLCLVPRSPLPADSGARQRMFHLMRALRSNGPIDIVSIDPLSAGERDQLAAAFDGSRVWAPTHSVRRRSGRLRWLTERRLPLSLALVDVDATMAGLTAFLDASPQPYGLVWSYTATPSWHVRHQVRDVPLVTDFADVQFTVRDRALAAARSAPDRWRPHALKDLLRLRIDRDRWGRFERDEGARADLMTVCSEVDRDQHGIAGAVVLVNGYEQPGAAGDHALPHAPPTLLLVGQMTYEPNAEGAVWFARHVLPAVQAELPGTAFVVAGRPGPAVKALAELAGVEVRGHVADLTDDLGRADVVVVPLRQGSGTRIKILEAWAHGIPVVTTTIGAEGLGVVDGRDVLVADDPATFAAATVAVIADLDVREKLIERGRVRFDAGYDWAIIEADLATRARDLLDGVSP